MTEPAIIGTVLAGGRGRRIGRDKATVDLNGRPLISYPIGALRAAGLEVVLALRNGQAAPRGIGNVGVVYDEFENAGPLAGLHALLKWIPGEWVLVISCDQPFVRVNLLHSMMAHVNCSADAIVTRTSEGLQPMPGLFHRSCLPVVAEAIERGELEMHRVLSRLSLYELPLNDADSPHLEPSSFMNVNTLEDLRAARRLASVL